MYTIASPEDDLHLVVTCAIEQAIVYQSIKKEGLEKSKTLPLSGNFDSVLCSHVMDVDWDGEKEILIGTYGRQVLIYKQGKEKHDDLVTIHIRLPFLIVAGTQAYTVLWKRQLAYPIYRMTHLDLNRDGLDELIISTMYGVHIFQVSHFFMYLYVWILIVL
ncbi:kaptin-like protein [Choanephora cucurbitarum]|nr:kaptin-like protein [Choanephora cucurbitarum]